MNDCIATLDALRSLDPLDPRFVAVQRAAAHLTKHAKRERRAARKREAARADRVALRSTTRVAAYFGGAPEPRTALVRTRRCYVCKAQYRVLHAHYHALCEPCAAKNFAARTDTADLAGRRAIVTGGRTKIGFCAARALLAAGADVTITTRFPADAARRWAGEPRQPTIVGLDFLDLRAVLAWLDAETAPLDILVNNAAQTVWRPPEYYAAVRELPTAALALVNEEGEPLDLRTANSWIERACDVAPVELVEVHLINAIAPFLFATRLRPLLARSAHADRFIVNVSAMEGVFAYASKQPRHPHTNMAKAALNMFTRTSATDFATDRIHMVSVDTGWITQENPLFAKRAAEEGGFVPPLDIVDGAARVLAPIWAGVRGAPIAGALLKDYEPHPW